LKVKVLLEVPNMRIPHVVVTVKDVVVTVKDVVVTVKDGVVTVEDVVVKDVVETV
jgi:hypothetical protein